MENIIDLLKKASDYYYNTEDYYEATSDEVNAVVNELGISCQSLMTDPMFDEIYKRAKEKYSSHPYFLTVGSEVRGEKVKLPEPMGSMVECKKGELSDWLVNNTDYVVSSKLDGNSALLVYENGNMKIAYSRGDGFLGQDITRHLKRFSQSIPSNVTNDGKPFTGMIRGEIIVSKKDIPLMIDELLEETHKEYKNGRNTVAGQLNSKDCANAFTKYARFVAYHISGFDNLTESERFGKLEELGFMVANYSKVTIEKSRFGEEYFENMVKLTKENDEYECDGIIVTQDRTLIGYEGFETSTLNPKCSRKYKVGAVDIYGYSKLLNIEWDISRFGVLKPVAVIEPVKIQDVEISRITLNNFKFIIDNNIKIGCRCKLSRAGSVIPYWVETIAD